MSLKRDREPEENENDEKDRAISQIRASKLFTHGAVAKILVGPMPETYYVHENLLCSSSGFFRAALQGSFKEGQTKEITMPEDDPEDFQCFTRWLYTGQVQLDTEDWIFTDRMISVYKFGQKICSDDLLNDTMDQLIKWCKDRNRILSQSGDTSYAELQKEVGMAKFWVDCHAWIQHTSNYTKENVEIARKKLSVSPFLSCAVLQRLSRLMKGEHDFNPVRHPSGCRYHVHSDGKTCETKNAEEKKSGSTPAKKT